jgi:hypothetical protein
MNERIRELADQAELTIRTSTGTYMSHPEFNKKFAELIVQECMSYMKDGDIDFAKFMIKRNFGVEE